MADFDGLVLVKRLRTSTARNASRAPGALLSDRILKSASSAKEAERASNEKLRVVINAAPAAILAFDLEGCVTLWNPAAEKLFGWIAAEVLGKPNPIVPTDRHNEYRAILERATRWL